MSRQSGHATPSRTVREGLNDLDDKRIKDIRPLIPPQILMEDYPLTMKAAMTVLEGRKGAEEIVRGEDDRLLVVVGPCSVHDVKAALEYAALLKAYADEASEDLHILMRVYFEKPRTTVGWKGLINGKALSLHEIPPTPSDSSIGPAFADPQLNGTFQINKGLRLARGLLLEIATMGLPAGCEFLDTISPQYTADLVSWGAIGARTTESQIHRELASGMSVPIGFKNGTDGSLQIAIDAIGSANASHSFLSVTKQGISAIVETMGNPSCHVILRGSNSGPNFAAEHVAKTAAALKKAGLTPKIMIDCSHGNSEKKHEKQVLVAEDVARQLGEIATAENIMGVMIESHLVAGKQSIPAEGPLHLTYGQSVTDACIDWPTTVRTLDALRAGVQARRALVGPLVGLNRAVGGARAREVSQEGVRDFNDANVFPVA